jgi:hypothetical protein
MGEKPLAKAHPLEEEREMKTVRRSLLLALAAGLGVCLGQAGPAAGQAKQEKKTNAAAAAEAAKAKVDPAAEAVANLALAHSLIAYGRKNNSPEALITAARILGMLPATSKLEGDPKSERDPKAPAGERKKESKPSDDSPAALLAEAKKMSKNAAHVVAAAEAVARLLEETKRGPVGGPIVGEYVVPAYSINTHRVTMRGDELWIVAISGDGDTRLDLEIYDEDGNFITADSGPGDDKVCRGVPLRTGLFFIRVINRGPVANRYLIGTR